MLTTKTGGFEIGFRRGWSDWQKDLDGLVAWANSNELGVIDVGNDADTSARVVTAAGLRVGSADLRSWSGFLSADAAKRREAASSNEEYISKAVEAGAKTFFAVMLPEDPAKPRQENFGYMVDGLNMLAPILEKYGACLAIEGWPGPGALCCTPETYRGTFKECPSPSIGVNYDPSHLIRMGIDPVRFVEEFAGRVHHVHGKDTALFADALYEYGTEQPNTFGTPHGFGSMTWRYTIPGYGVTPWSRVFEVLQGDGYSGAVCIELEDENFNGTLEGERKGILEGAGFLARM